jgi:uncharacterized protein (TIGR02147 family)
MPKRKIYANIYEFADFRKFLDEYQKNRSKIDNRFKRSEICRKLGLPNTRSFFNDVVKGRKDISSAFVERFVGVLELEDDEAQYFRALVKFNQSMIEKERDLLFDQLIALNKTPHKFVNPEEYTYYSEWHHSAIRALLDVFDIKDDYKLIGRSLLPAISPSKAEQSIQLLNKLGFIRKNKQGYWKPAVKAITTGPYAKDELVKQFQLKSLEMGKRALISFNNEPNSTSTMTLSMSPKIQQKIEERIQQLKKEIRSMVHKDTRPANVVYQLNMQFFPQSKRAK